jgi:hypothetical protein
MLQSIFHLNSPEQLIRMALNLGLIKLQGTFRWISSLEEKKDITKHKIMRYGPVNYGDLQFMSIISLEFVQIFNTLTY